MAMLALATPFVTAFAPWARAANFGGEDDITAVSSRASSDYIRVRQADGSYVPETYTFGKGGIWEGAMQDASMDKLTFLSIAHTIAGPLAHRQYYPSTDPSKTKLLIMVYWGTTRAPEHASQSNGYVNMEIAGAALANATAEAQGMSPAAGGAIRSAADDQLSTALALVQAENKQRQRDDLANIRMLGYDSWLEKTNTDSRGTAFEQSKRDLYDEVEANRYFVVLMAYDFQLMWKEKKHVELWETRFSIRQQHHEFDKDLPVMAAYASRYFGQDSHGLVHDEIPLGQVEIGDVKSLGEVTPQK